MCLFNCSPRKEELLRALLLSESEISQCLRHPLHPQGLFCALGAANIGLQTPVQLSCPSRRQGLCASRGFSWHSPCAMQTSQALLALAPCPVPRGISAL